MSLVVKVRTFIVLSFLRYLYMYHFWSWQVSTEKMSTVIMAITVVKLPTVRLRTKLACWANSALASPFSILSMHLYMGKPVVTFCPTKTFWTKSTKIIHSSGVPESFNHVLAWSTIAWSNMTRIVYILAWLEIFLFWTFKRNNWINQLSRLGFLFLGDFILHFVLLSYLAICGQVTLLCPIMKIGWRKDLFELTLTWHN